MKNVCRSIVLLLVGLAIIMAINSSALAAKDEAKAAERRAKYLERYPEADANKDGVLSDSEMKEYLRNRKDSKQSRGKASDKRAEMDRELLQVHPGLDTNGNGRLDGAERKTGRDIISGFYLEKKAQQILAETPEADLNRDGFLSPDEMKAYQKSKAARSKSQTSPAKVVAMLIGNFQKIDTDGSGELSKQELVAFRKQLEKSELEKKKNASKSKKTVKKSAKGNKAGKPTKNKQETQNNY